MDEKRPTAEELDKTRGDEEAFKTLTTVKRGEPEAPRGAQRLFSTASLWPWPPPGLTAITTVATPAAEGPVRHTPGAFYVHNLPRYAAEALNPRGDETTPLEKLPTGPAVAPLIELAPNTRDTRLTPAVAVWKKARSGWPRT